MARAAMDFWRLHSRPSCSGIHSPLRTLTRGHVVGDNGVAPPFGRQRHGVHACSWSAQHNTPAVRIAPRRRCSHRLSRVAANRHRGADRILPGGREPQRQFSPP